MKINEKKVSKKWTYQKIVGNANHIYRIRWFKRQLTGAVSVDVGVDVGVDVSVAVSVDVSVSVFFVMLLRWFFEKKRQTKMKLKARFKKSEQKNWGNTHCKYAIIGFNWYLPHPVSITVVWYYCFCAFSELVVWKPAR